MITFFFIRVPTRKWLVGAIGLAIGFCVAFARLPSQQSSRHSEMWVDWLALPSVSLRAPFSSESGMEDSLNKFRLRSPASTGDLLHFWRLWTSVDGTTLARLSAAPTADSTNDLMTPARVQSIFLNETTFLGYYGATARWFATSGNGPIVKRKHPHSDAVGETHPDEFLSVLAECRVGVREPIVVGDAVFAVDDLLRRSTERYVASDDSAFSTVAFAIYFAESGGFTTKSNEWVSFDMLVETIISQPLDSGACHGTHNCYAVAALLNLQGSSRVLSPSMHRRANRYLQEVASQLAAAQHRDGAWRADWPSGTATEPPMWAEPGWGDAIAVTGHHLEWLALVPSGGLPQERLAAAIRFVADEIEKVSSDDVDKAYPPWSHAMRALIMWEQRRRHSSQHTGDAE